MDTANAELNMNPVDRLFEPIRLMIETSYEWYIAHYFGANNKYADLCITLFVVIGLFWLVGSLYTVIDILQRPQSIYRYKIHRCPKELTRLVLWRIFKLVTLNQMLAIVLILVVNIAELAPEKRKHFPCLSSLIFEWLLFLTIREMLFYYSHRMLHWSKFLYKNVHKMHHDWKHPIAISSIYCHPFEHLLCNMIPVIAGPALLSSHPLVNYIWLSYANVLALHDHSGYHFPFDAITAEYHDYHHYCFNANFGINGLFDWIHRTNKNYPKSQHYENAGINFTLQPGKKVG